MSNQDQFNWLNGGIGFEMAYMTDCYFVATVEYNYWLFQIKVQWSWSKYDQEAPIMINTW